MKKPIRSFSFSSRSLILSAPGAVRGLFCDGGFAAMKRELVNYLIVNIVGRQSKSGLVGLDYAVAELDKQEVAVGVLSGNAHVRVEPGPASTSCYKIHITFVASFVEMVMSGKGQIDAMLFQQRQDVLAQAGHWLLSR